MSGSKRYTVEHESGSDWAIFDNKDKRNRATGLSSDEAEETAKAWNSKSEEKGD